MLSSLLGQCFPPLGLLVSGGLLLTAQPGAAAWQPNGVLVCGNASTQDVPTIASDGAGGAYIMWRDQRDYGVTNYDHYLQHITASGDLAPGWPADGVPLCTAPGPQFFFFLECLIADGQGGAIATWWDRRNGTDDDIYAQRITAAGTPAPGWPVDGVRLTALPYTESRATLASDGAGGAFIVWEDTRHYVYPTNQADLYATHVLADGTLAPGWPENGLPICTLEGWESLPQPIADGAGGVLIIWSSGAEMRAIRLTATGERAAGWAENGNLVLGLSHTKGRPLALPDGAGGLLVAWNDYRTLPPGPVSFPDDYSDLYAQHVRADGTLDPGWPADGLPVCIAPGRQATFDVAPDGAGGMFMVWTDDRGLFTTNYSDVYGMRVRADGTLAPGWAPDGVRLSNEPGYQLYPVRVAEDGAGGMYAVYSDFPEGDRKLTAQHLTGDGALFPGWPANGRRVVEFAGSQQNQDMISNGLGGAIVAWTDHRGAPDGSTDIYAQRIGPDGPTPVLVSLVSAEAEPGLVRLTWFAGEGASLIAEVERRTETGEWERLQSITADGTGKLSYEDRTVVAGARYAYRLAYPDGAGTTHSAETWVTVPALRFALRGLTPNPSAGDPVVAFSLSSAEPASLELYDLSGRLVGSRDVSSFGAGAHTVSLDMRRRLSAGVYTVVLRQGPEIATARAVVIR